MIDIISENENYRESLIFINIWESLKKCKTSRQREVPLFNLTDAKQIQRMR